MSFIIQKLLIHEDRAREKKAQDILYIHDTLELFGEEIEDLAIVWKDTVRGAMHVKWVNNLLLTKDALFRQVNDRIRGAAVLPQDRQLDPERMRAMCHAALGEILE